MKYLGVIIDHHLTFKRHCEYVAKKMSKKVNYLRRIRARLNEETALLLFKSLIVPQYDYCSTILFLVFDSDLRNLQLIQNRALRVILNAARDTSIASMLERCDVMTVKQRINYNVLIFIFKAMHHLLPAYLSDQLNYVATSQPYSLRRNEIFRLPNMLSRVGQNSLMFKGVKMFNEMMMTGVDISQGLKEFKVKLSDYIKRIF